MELRRVNFGDYDFLKKMAEEILVPLYGNQDKALCEWLSGEGFKHAFVFASGTDIAGFLSLKANPTKPYLKISTLMIFEGHKKLGYGKKLLAQAKKIAKDLGYSRIKVTVSDSKQESLSFFSKSGFIIVDKWVDKYKPGSTEYIFEMEVPA